MTTTDIGSMVERVPFRRFRFSLTNGLQFEIPSPNHIMSPPEATKVMVFTDGSVHYIEPQHIVQVEEFDIDSEETSLP